MAIESGGRTFISYAHADVLSARRLKSALAVQGYDTWLAPDDMVGRASWAGELLREIERCRAFVVLVGRSTLTSEHVQREVTLAIERDKVIIPVLLEPVTLDGPLAYLLSTRHWVEAEEAAPAAAVTAIVRRIASEEEAPTESSVSRMSGRARRGKVSWDASRVPVPLDPIIGRATLIESVVDAIRSGRRLITLRGPGGVGKTRLALAVAQVVAEEGVASVVFADLSEAVDATSLMVGMANALGYAGPSPEDPGDVAAATLTGDPRLLVCDNLEQVAAHCAPLHELLESAPGLIALGTSRRRLGLAGESVIVVPPLELPSETDQAGSAPAVEVFLQAARHAVPDYTPTPAELQDVHRLCRALDGLPLALELAASRLAIMSPAQLWERVGRPLSTRPAALAAVDRHASVEATISWSLSLLSPQAMTGFTRLGVFQGGFTLHAAEQVCASEGETEADVDDWLSELVDASLVLTADAPSGRRFLLLQLLLAEARRRSSDESLDQRHAEYFAHLAEGQRHLMVGPSGAVVTKRLIDELSNWSQALRWAARHDPHLYCRLARGWRGVWAVAPRPAEVLASPLSEEGRAALSESESATLDLLSAIAANLAGASGARDALEQAVSRESALEADSELVVLAWSFLAAARVVAGDLDDARDAAARARAHALGRGDAHCEAIAYDISGWVASFRGDLVEGRGFVERSIALAEQESDPVGVCFGLNTLGVLLIEQGDSVETRACANRLLDLVQEGRGLEINETQGHYLRRMADIMDGDLTSAARHLLDALGRQDPLAANILGDLVTAAAVLAWSGDADTGSLALAQAHRLAARFEIDLGEPAAPLRDHLAGLSSEPLSRPGNPADQSPNLVPDEVMAGLASIAGVTPD